MSPGSVREYAKVMRERYHGATKKERGSLLDEFCRVTGYHRKAVVRLLGCREGELRQGRGRAPRYGSAVVVALEQLWEASDWLSPQASWWECCRTWWRPWSAIESCSWSPR